MRDATLAEEAALFPATFVNMRADSLADLAAAVSEKRFCSVDVDAFVESRAWSRRIARLAHKDRRQRLAAEGGEGP